MAPVRWTLAAILFGGALVLSSSAARAAAGVVRVVIAGAEEPEELHQRLRQLVGGPWEVRSESTPTTEIAPDDLFGPGDGAAGDPAVWILVGDGAARIRAADGARQLFVFRDLVVAAPLTELDRERIAQVASAALAAVLEGRPGALDRTAVTRLVGAEPPPAPSPPPPVAAASAVTAPPAPKSPPAAAPGGPWVGAASYEVQSSGRAPFQGPGLAAGLRVTDGAHPLTIGLQGQFYLPVAMAEGTIHQYVLRVLAALRLVRWMDAGLGAGIAYIGGQGENVNASYGSHRAAALSGRLFVRGGPLTVAGVRLSGTLSVDLDPSLYDFWNWYTPPPARARPGLALELWWR